MDGPVERSGQLGDAVIVPRPDKLSTDCEVHMSNSTRVSDEETPFSDDELSALALAADPDAPIDLDAKPWYLTSNLGSQLLPEWYMPIPMSRGRGRVSKVAAISVVVGMVVVCAFGLCVTSGFLQLA